MYLGSIPENHFAGPLRSVKKIGLKVLSKHPVLFWQMGSVSPAPRWSTLCWIRTSSSSSTMRFITSALPRRVPAHFLSLHTEGPRSVCFVLTMRSLCRVLSRSVYVPWARHGAGGHETCGAPVAHGAPPACAPPAEREGAAGEAGQPETAAVASREGSGSVSMFARHESDRPLTDVSHCWTDEGAAVSKSRDPHLQGHLDRPGPVVCAGRSSGLAHLVGLFVGRHGTRHLLHHLRHQHGSLCLLCPHQTGKTETRLVFSSCSGFELVSCKGIVWHFVDVVAFFRKVDHISAN